MAIAPDLGWQDHPAPRPVLSAVTAALDTLAGSTPQRLWALGEGEVTEAFVQLARLRASVDAHLVAVLAEATHRGLGAGDGWGPHDWLAPLRTRPGAGAGRLRSSPWSE